VTVGGMPCLDLLCLDLVDLGRVSGRHSSRHTASVGDGGCPSSPSPYGSSFQGELSEDYPKGDAISSRVVGTGHMQGWRRRVWKGRLW
jgi:hypothetical protein